MNLTNDTAPFTNLEYLRTTCGGANDMMKQILDMFLQSSPASISQMKKCIGEANWPDLKREAHKAKSSFLMMGAKITGAKLQEMETNSGENPDAISMIDLLDAIEKESAIIYTEIKTEIMNL
jgi:HPt (histidine-containing phosphotransfer) domain-containing protein